MVNSNADALGIIFPNSYDTLVPELVSERLMASIPFAGRYRMVDFILSSMVNHGIGNISIIVRKNYHSLLPRRKSITPLCRIPNRSPGPRSRRSSPAIKNPSLDLFRISSRSLVSSDFDALMKMQ